jgi:hypothetical protein
VKNDYETRVLALKSHLSRPERAAPGGESMPHLQGL